MDKYKKVVLKLLRIHGEEAMDYMRQYNEYKKRLKKYYCLDYLSYAISSYKKYKQYKIIPESAIKGYHSEWL